LRTLTLAKSGLNKLRATQKELKHSDLDDSIKSVPPGEWCLLTHSTLSTNYVCFINPLIDEKYSCVQIVGELSSTLKIAFDPEEMIKNKILGAFKKRQRYLGYEKGSRIFYGQSDGLPGLIIDQFLDKAIIQINTAGIDRYRNQIRVYVEDVINGKAFFLDNTKYREKEFLPIYESEVVPSFSILENDLTFFLRNEVMQKVGFYYDHRENRYQLINTIKRLNKRFSTGVDLFCYAGAWGQCALKAGVEKIDFVDQGDFNQEIQRGLEDNNFLGRGTFFRSDVFKYLDERISQEKLFDIILCDPPAFAKSLSQKEQALTGYTKLHRKVFKAAAPGALICFSSCTHYVSHEEFQKNILDAAAKENRTLQLIYSGLQGWDHPVSSLMDKSNYIKCYFYLLES
jgi:23S rRNA (cytosine1962-C5)-methyltransferase